MKIVESYVTLETCDRFREGLQNFPELQKAKVILNYANSKFNQNKYQDYLIS